MKVLVVGANGKTGTRIVKLLTGTANAPVAMIRDPAQRSTFDEMGVFTVVGDLEYPIDHAVRGCDAVIFAAGSGSRTEKDKTVLVDQLDAIRAMVTAQIQGARRFIILSSLNADIHSTSPDRALPQGQGARTRVGPGEAILSAAAPAAGAATSR